LPIGDETGHHTTLCQSSGTFPSHHYIGKTDIEGGLDRLYVGKVRRLNRPDWHFEDFRPYPWISRSETDRLGEISVGSSPGQSDGL